MQRIIQPVPRQPRVVRPHVPSSRSTPISLRSPRRPTGRSAGDESASPVTGAAGNWRPTSTVATALSWPTRRARSSIGWRRSAISSRGILEERGVRRDQEVVSVLVFRLADEWLALPTTALVEVTKERRCHRVPHRTGSVLEGLVNIRGQLQLCVSAQRLLGIEEAAAEPRAATGDLIRVDDPELRRLLVVERLGRHGADRWVFPVEQVAGVIRVGQATLRAVPATVSQSGARFCQALFDWQGVIVGILDETRFLDGLNDQVRST